MTQSPAVLPTGRSGPVRIGERAARVLVSELARINEPKAALLVDASPESLVLVAAIEALLPGDTLTVVPAVASDAGMLREHVAAQGPWVAERVRVVDALADAEAAAVAIIGEPLTGTVEETRATLDGLGRHLDTGAVLSVATPATPKRTGGAADELDRQAALHGVGSDLLLRNNPPLRVHRLRFRPASAAAAVGMAPAYRPSSVPLTRTMHIDSNGVAAAGIALGLAAVARVARPTSKLWLLPALATAPVAAFFRDPEREVPADPSAVVASADGKVLSVQRLSDERFGEGEWLRIAVFLSVLDVHINRSPVPGKVVDYFVTDGGFANAMKPDAEHNVAAYTVLDTTNGTVIVAQRTGLIARRIVQRAPIGSLLAKGERFGLIRFGSRTDVYLPADAAQPLVGPGDRVVGGSSVIARWH
ncbi:phosphatidylserine decarboxylase [Salinispora tropica]|uniref:Phosphatidylserine decarboxylase related protein n=1 Tax=Salinispora tropica (strain ATCC BAA-916 / DSM 44818 / JCM 13857 / NBRC 105044 / CNB-440) TaxID=369723 RepID=A4XBG0_SALTO|nr:phosphatidylserine decarboxylase [Salinispora tropica]ABP56259.1 phosphatidylserine decarboxylase related protein [Salinispora tropica CNB-440]